MSARTLGCDDAGQTVKPHSSFGGTKSVMSNWVEDRPFRLLVYITFVRSGKTIGSTPLPGA
jgi:hypothetical protein